MSFRLKENLLIQILGAENNINKYSKSLLNLKTIIELEQKEGFSIPEDIKVMYKDIIKREENFIFNIPLKLVEKYFYSKKDNLNSYVNIFFGNDSELTIKTSELFIELEKFYDKIFLIASLIASYYNLEVKISNDNQNKSYI